MQQAFAGSVKARLWAGLVVGVIGLTAVIGAIGPLRFAERFADRVDVVGTVQAGYDLDLNDGTEISDGEHGAWKVDYQVGGARHVGFIVGTYRVGEQVEISAPADGSVYGVLTERVAPVGKVLSWLLIVLGVPAIVAGSVLMTQATRERNRQIRAEVERRYGLPPLAAGGHPATGGGQVSGPAGSAAEPPYAHPWHGAQRSSGPAEGAPPEKQNPFFKPYDL